MLVMETIFRWSTPVLYGLCAFFYIKQFVNKEQREKLLDALNALITVSFTLFLVFRSINQHRCPFGSVPEAVLFSMWMLTITYYLIERYANTRSVGILVLPVNFVVCLLCAVFLNTGQSLPAGYRGFFFPFHVTLSLTGYCAFLLSLIIGILNLVHINALKQKRIGFFYSRLPSLGTLDRLVMICVGVGLIFLLGGMVVGELWTRHINVNLFSISTKKIATLLTWCIYAFQFISIKRLGWTGRRSAIISVIGFIMLLISLSLGRHGY
jgi:ABC-type transport system involved in cytochrome c biogenesis permease subunit